MYYSVCICLYKNSFIFVKRDIRIYKLQSIFFERLCKVLLIYEFKVV